MRKSLRNILGKLGEHKLFGPKEVAISGITYDSRKVKKGYLFVAVSGSRVDGHDYISQAQNRGARVVVGERPLVKAGIKAGTTYIKVKDSRRALALIASFWFNNPSEKLTVIGVTGTDGKTTTASLIFEILKESGKRTALITTVGAKIGRREYETGLHVTSPDPITLNRFLAKMVSYGFKYAVVEVTSHGIDQKRIAGVKFDIGVLTNITREHTDYHKTFEKYRDTKLNFLKGIKTIVINKEDSSYDYAYRKLAKMAQIYTYALSKPADFRALKANYHNKGTTFNLKLDGDLISLKSNLKAPFNILNTLAAIAVAKHLKVQNSAINKALQSIKPPPGRLENIDFGRKFNIIIDFAHTPNALENTLGYLKSENRKGRIIAVFGCAGERDRAKRLKMGEISAKLVDISVFTAEDPRSENVYQILKEIIKGAKKAKAKEFTSVKKAQRLDKKVHWFTQIPERGEAIAYAIQKLAEAYDTVVICGKGHEKSMAYNSTEHPWSDHGAASSTLNTKKDLAVVVMAAGEGTRMKSQTPKVLHKIAGRPMIAYTIANLRKAGMNNIYVVVGYKEKEVMKALGGAVTYITQKKRLGTADAVKMALAKIPNNINEILVVNGDDSSFYRPDTFNKIRTTQKQKKAQLSFVTLVLDDPKGLGRILRDKSGNLLGIVEEKDATAAQRKIKEVNDGLYVFERAWLEKTLPKVKKSPASKEFYLVSLIEIALKESIRVNAYKLKDPNEWFGVNTKAQLLLADKKMRENLKNAK